MRWWERIQTTTDWPDDDKENLMPPFDPLYESGGPPMPKLRLRDYATLAWAVCAGCWYLLTKAIGYRQWRRRRRLRWR